MTPQERQLIDDLFDRLAKVENAPRDPDAQAAIADGLRRAPNAVYALVQTVLVQDEALKHAEAHIRELEERAQPQQQQSGGFLDSMRDSLLGPSSRGSVPNVRPGDSGAPRGPVWNTGQTGYQPDPRANPDYRQGAPGGGGFGGGLFGGGNQQAGAPGGGGGSFPGTAAATAAGVIGGSMLMNSMRGMFGGSGSHQQSFGDTTSSTKSPWDNNQSSGNQSGGDLSRDAGLNDVGKSDRDDNSRQSLADNSSYDQASNNYNDDNDDDNDDDYDGDDDFGGSDDSDFA